MKLKTIDKDTLIKTIGFLRQGYTKRVYARDKNGVVCYFTDENACSFCLMGALFRSGAKNTDIQELFSGLIPASMGLTDFNDSADHTVEQVIDLVEKAIAKLETV